jgi:hypothetical protein
MKDKTKTKDLINEKMSKIDLYLLTSTKSLIIIGFIFSPDWYAISTTTIIQIKKQISIELFN